MNKLIRHGLAAFAAWLITTHGIDVDAASTVSIVGGLVLFGISYVWSVYSKDPISADSKQRIRILVTALVQQGIAALAGYLHASGHEVSVENPEALVLFLGNLMVSKVARPDAKLPSIEELHRTGLLVAAFFIPLSLASCKTIFTQDNAAMMAKQLAIAAAEIGINHAQQALEAELKKPHPDQAKILSLQLGVLLARQQLNNVKADLALPLPETPLPRPVINPLLPPPSGKAVLGERLW